MTVNVDVFSFFLCFLFSLQEFPSNSSVEDDAMSEASVDLSHFVPRMASPSNSHVVSIGQLLESVSSYHLAMSICFFSIIAALFFSLCNEIVTRCCSGACGGKSCGRDISFLVPSPVQHHDQPVRGYGGRPPEEAIELVVPRKP